MDSRITVLKILGRLFLALVLVIVIGGILFAYVNELADSEPNAAVVGLLSTTGAVLGVGLLKLIESIASNPSDETPNGPGKGP